MGRRLYTYSPTAGGSTLNIPLGTMTLTPQAPTLSVSGGSGVTFFPAPGISIFPSNQMVEGQTYQLTVPAGGLGARTNALPLYWFPMDVANGLSTHPTLSRTQFTMASNGNSQSLISTANPYPNSTGSYQYLVTSTSGAASNALINPAGGPLFRVPGGPGYQMYWNIKHQWGFATKPNNDKFWRIYSSPTVGGGVGTNPDAYYAMGGGGSYLSAVENNPNYSVAPPNSGGAFLPIPFATGWCARELFWQENTYGISDGLQNMAVNGVFGWPSNIKTGVCAINNGGTSQGGLGNNQTGVGPMTDIYLEQYSAFPPPDGVSNLSYMGPIYGDDSYLQLILTNEGSTYQTATGTGSPQWIRENQVQTSRSDTAVQFVFRKGMFSSLTSQNLIATTGYMQGMNLGSFAAPFDYFISTTGSDSNPGTLASPWALTAINSKRATYAGKRVGVLPGTYNCLSLVGGSYTGDFSSPAFSIAGGSVGNQTAIQSTTTRGAILDGGATVGNNPNGQPLIGCITTGGFAGVGYITLDGFEIKNTFNRAISMGASTGASFSGTRLQGIVCQNHYIHDQTNSLGGANPTGITLYSCDGALIQNNFMQRLFDTTGRASGIEIWTSYNTVTRFNTIIASANGSVGILHKNSSQKNNTIQYNFIDMTLAGTSNSNFGITCDADGGAGTFAQISNNVVIGDNPITPAAIFVGGYPNTLHTKNIFNNTFIGIPGCSVGVTIFFGGSGTLDYYNNITQRSTVGGRTDLNTNNSTLAKLDYNLYPAAGQHWGFTANGSFANPTNSPASQAALTTFLNTNAPACIGKDAHAVLGAPTYVGTGTHAQFYQLSSGSLGHLTGSTDGTTSGTATDMGAWGNGAVQVGSVINGVYD